jgi:hypothetical protein
MQQKRPFWGSPDKKVRCSVGDLCTARPSHPQANPSEDAQPRQTTQPSPRQHSQDKDPNSQTTRAEPDDACGAGPDSILASTSPSTLPSTSPSTLPSLGAGHRRSVRKAGECGHCSVRQAAAAALGWLPQHEGGYCRSANVGAWPQGEGAAPARLCACSEPGQRRHGCDLLRSGRDVGVGAQAPR